MLPIIVILFIASHLTLPGLPLGAGPIFLDLFPFSPGTCVHKSFAIEISTCPILSPSGAMITKRENICMCPPEPLELVLRNTCI